MRVGSHFLTLLVPPSPVLFLHNGRQSTPCFPPVCSTKCLPMLSLAFVRSHWDRSNLLGSGSSLSKPQRRAQLVLRRSQCDLIGNGHHHRLTDYKFTKYVLTADWLTPLFSHWLVEGVYPIVVRRLFPDKAANEK